MARRTIQPPNLAVPSAPYVPAVVHGDTVWVSGQVSLSADGSIVGDGDIRAQTRQVLENLGSCLASAGFEFSDVVKTTVYLTDIDNYSAFNEVYAQFFPQDPPARSTIVANPLVRPELLIEIEAVASGNPTTTGVSS